MRAGLRGRLGYVLISLLLIIVLFLFFLLIVLIVIVLSVASRNFFASRGDALRMP